MTNKDESDKAIIKELLVGWNSLSNRSARIELLEAQLTAFAEEISRINNLSPEERIRFGKLSSLVRALTGE